MFLYEITRGICVLCRVALFIEHVPMALRVSAEVFLAVAIDCHSSACFPSPLLQHLVVSCIFSLFILQVNSISTYYSLKVEEIITTIFKEMGRK